MKDTYWTLCDCGYCNGNLWVEEKLENPCIIVPEMLSYWKGEKEEYTLEEELYEIKLLEWANQYDATHALDSEYKE